MLELVNLGLDSELAARKLEAGVHVPEFKTVEDFEGCSQLGFNYPNLLDGLEATGVVCAVDYHLTTKQTGISYQPNTSQESSLMTIGFGRRPLTRVDTINQANRDLWNGTLASQYYLEKYEKAAKRDEPDATGFNAIKWFGCGLVGVIGAWLHNIDGPYATEAIFGFSGVSILYYSGRILLADSYVPRLYGRSLRKTAGKAGKLAITCPVVEHVSK